MPRTPSAPRLPTPQAQFYIGILGLLLPAYAYTGYDGPAHMAEESHNPSIANPRCVQRAPQRQLLCRKPLACCVCPHCCF